MPKNWLNYAQKKLMTDFSQKTIFKINDIILLNQHNQLPNINKEH